MASTAILTAGTVMDTAAALQNDVAKAVYTYVTQVPYLNIALRELQESFELNGLSVTDAYSAAVTVPVGDTSIEFDAIAPHASLPTDLIEPTILWERTTGVNPYIPMDRIDFLPHFLEGTTLNQLSVFTWSSQKILFLPATVAIDVKMDYIRRLFMPMVDQNSSINIINAQSFLEFRTGALLAQFIGENKSRADELNSFAVIAADRSLGIQVKGKQSIVVRRRPFRASYKTRGSF